MEKNLRLIFSGILTLVVIIIFWIFGDYLFSNIVGILLISVAVLIIIFSFILETFFTKPVDVIATTISIILLLLPQLNALKMINNKLGYYVLYAYFIYVSISLVISVVSQILLTKRKSSSSLQNKLSLLFKKLVETFSNSRILYLALGLIVLFGFVYDNKKVFLILISYFIVVYFLAQNQKNIQKLYNKYKKDKVHDYENSIGQIIGTSNEEVYIVKLYEDSTINIFDTVVFRTNFRSNRIYKGIVIDNMMLNESERISILKLSSYDEVIEIRKGEVFKLNNDDVQKIIGLVEEKTDVSKILFRYIPKISIEVGDVLGIEISNKTVLYQVTNGMVKTEKLSSNDKNGFIIGEAIQIGVWNEEEESFERYGWTPSYNMPIYKYECEIEDIPTDDIDTVGSVPNTNYKIKFNYEEGLRHHLAILGVTGCGKSVLSRKIIRNVLDRDIKVIAVDFTNEYINKFEKIKKLFSTTNIKESLYYPIKNYALEMSKFASQRSNSVISDAIDQVIPIIQTEFQDFLDDEEKNIAILEYPEMTNSLVSVSFIEWFFKYVFEYIRENGIDKKVCFVLEEAHTIVPEWNFISGADTGITKQMINTIGQIALQGRKHDIGFIVIAQRTANVSKTVLTQCNSIIAFQQFDNTSKDFLSNHLSDDMTKALPFLKPRHAIVSGMGFASTSPVIIRVPDIEEEEFEYEEVVHTDIQTQEGSSTVDLPF